MILVYDTFYRDSQISISYETNGEGEFNILSARWSNENKSISLKKLFQLFDRDELYENIKEHFEEEKEYLFDDDDDYEDDYDDDHLFEKVEED